MKTIIAKKYAELKNKPRWFASSFDQQIKFITDPSPLKLGLCTRRAGKSYGTGIYLCKEAYETPGVTVIYVALTRESAERIMWKDILKVINREHNLNAHFNDQKLIMTLPNGSVIYLGGADARKDEMDKLLGQKFKLCVIDEASKYRIDVHRMIFDVLKPAISDYNGTIAMIGTPTDFINSYFIRAARHLEKGWSVHRWSALDNPHMHIQFQREIDEHIERNPSVINESWFRQNYYGDIVVNTYNLIYKYSEANIIDNLPELPYHYVLSINLSFGAKSALVVGAYSPRARDAYIVEARELESNDIHIILEEAKKLNGDYNFVSIICADVSKKLASEIRARFGLSVEEYRETDKAGLIKLFCSELAQKNIKVLRKNSDIIYEWDSIVKDDSFNRGLREDPRCPNHIATAALYAWQKCYNYNYLPKVTSEDPNDAFWEKLAQDIDNAAQQLDNDDDFIGYD